jgi:hypothetical protein
MVIISDFRNGMQNNGDRIKKNDGHQPDVDVQTQPSPPDG